MLNVHRFFLRCASIWCGWISYRRNYFRTFWWISRSTIFFYTNICNYWMKILLILVGINAWCGQQNVVILVQCVYVSYRSVLNCERFTYRQVFVFNIHSNAIEAFCLRHGRCDAQCDATTRIVAHTIDRIPNCMDSNHMSIGLRYAYTFDSALWTCCSLHKYMQVWDCDIFGGNWRMGQTLYIYASWFS